MDTLGLLGLGIVMLLPLVAGGITLVLSYNAVEVKESDLDSRRL